MCVCVCMGMCVCGCVCVCAHACVHACVYVEGVGGGGAKMGLSCTIQPKAWNAVSLWPCMLKSPGSDSRELLSQWPYGEFTSWGRQSSHCVVVVNWTFSSKRFTHSSGSALRGVAAWAVSEKVHLFRNGERRKEGMHSRNPLTQWKLCLNVSLLLYFWPLCTDVCENAFCIRGMCCK